MQHGSHSFCNAPHWSHPAAASCSDRNVPLFTDTIRCAASALLGFPSQCSFCATVSTCGGGICICMLCSDVVPFHSCPCYQCLRHGMKRQRHKSTSSSSSSSSSSVSSSSSSSSRERGSGVCNPQQRMKPRRIATQNCVCDLEFTCRMMIVDRSLLGFICQCGSLQSARQP